jgi:outer membrane protein TolC
MIAALIICSLLGGCAAHVHRDVAAFVGSTMDRQILAPESGNATLLGAEDRTVFTFKQAVERASHYDPDVLDALAEAQQLQLDLKQAHSEIWPRVDLRTYFQIPLGGNNLQGVQVFSGGVFFRYDIQKMLFSSDLSAVARARLDESRENLGLAIDRLAQNLLGLLSERESLRTEVTLRRSITAQASRVLEHARALERIGDARAQQVFAYKQAYDNSDRDYQDAVRRLAETNRAICTQLMMDCSEDITISDLPQLLSSLEVITAISRPDEDILRGVWEKRHDTRVAELDLFLKEMAVINAQREKIPTISPSIGLGSIGLTSSFSQAPAVVQLGVYMPVIDFGDIKRQIAKAAIERDKARQNITLLSLKVQRELIDSSASYNEAVAAWSDAQTHCKLLSEQSETGRQLIESGISDPLEFSDTDIRALELEIEVARSRANVLKAAGQYAVASGWNLLDRVPVPTVTGSQ